MKNTTIIPAIMLLASVALAGCATIWGGAKYNAHVVVNNLPDAKISYRGETKGYGNTTFKVKRREADDFTISVSGEGAPERQYNFNKRKFRGWAFAGSFLTYYPTFIVDIITGAYWKPDVKESGVVKVDYDNFEYMINYTTESPIIPEIIALKKFDQEVDKSIPVNPQENDKTFVVIIANENYAREAKVQYAINDGRIFRDYCEKTLGIPASNIHLAADATYGTMRAEVRWLVDVMAAYQGQARAIFYYAGHGMPDESDRTACLMPSDGFSTDFETAISLDELYQLLSKHPAKSVTVFLDACFSGSQRNDGMLASARGMKVKPKATLIPANMVVFSATTGDETAYPYDEKQHGLFTYFLLKKLQETWGEVNYRNLADYITENVQRRSIVVNNKLQTPQVMASWELDDKWQTMTLR